MRLRGRILVQTGIYTWSTTQHRDHRTGNGRSWSVRSRWFQRRAVLASSTSLASWTWGSSVSKRLDVTRSSPSTTTVYTVSGIPPCLPFHLETTPLSSRRRLVRSFRRKQSGSTTSTSRLGDANKVCNTTVRFNRWTKWRYRSENGVVIPLVTPRTSRQNIRHRNIGLIFANVYGLRLSEFAKLLTFLKKSTLIFNG